MRIVIPDDYQKAVAGLACLKKLAGHQVTILGALDRDPAAAAALAEAEALVLIRERTRVDSALLARCPRLGIISQTGKVSGHIDLAACAAAKVRVVEGTGSPVAPAELTWALIMASRRQLVPAIEAMRQGAWQINIGRALAGQRLGIWGFGKIGRLIARYGAAFAMEVTVWGSEASRAAAIADGYRASASRDALFADSDIVTLHLRLNDATRGLVTAADLGHMKPDALLVNTSRAELIAPGALEAALDRGRPGFAALDVFEREPIWDPAHPLLNSPNVLCTPHLGYVEQGGYELYFATAFDNLLAAAGSMPP